MNRRALLKLSGGLGIAATMPLLIQSAVAGIAASGNGAEILTVSDGSLMLPPSFALPDVPKEELEKLIGELPTEEALIDRPLNLTLFRTNDRTVLFDVGSGPNFMPSAGKLGESLDALGVSPEDVTDVVFTHGHPDHLWGILDDFDEVWFPDAQLHFPRVEFDYWMDASTVDNMPEERKVFAVGAKNRLEAIADQVRLFEADDEVVPMVEAMPTYGHTPGHTSFVIHGTGDPMMVLGDALINDIFSFQRPKWPAGGDHDKDAAIQTRLKLLDRLAAEKMQIIGYHLSNNGVGQVEKSGDAFRFIPI